MREGVITNKEVNMGGGGSAPKAVAYEPIKSAEQTMKDAASESARNQQLRRGLASTFSRSTIGGSGAAKSVTPATSGSASKLGG